MVRWYLLLNFFIIKYFIIEVYILIIFFLRKIIFFECFKSLLNLKNYVIGNFVYYIDDNVVGINVNIYIFVFG